MYKYLLGLSLFFSGVANSQNALDPVSSAVSRIKQSQEQNKIDTTEIAYVGTRCGALYGALAAYFESNGNASDAEAISNFRRQGDAFIKVALTLNLGANRMTTEAITEQATTISKYYFVTMSDGKRLNNNVFTPYIQADLAACKIELDGYRQFAARIK